VWSLPECSRPTAAPCTKRQRQIYTRTTRCRLTDAVHPLTHYTVLTALVFPSQSWLPSRSWGVWAASAPTLQPHRSHCGHLVTCIVVHPIPAVVHLCHCVDLPESMGGRFLNRVFEPTTPWMS
jgi:hypothetical protein